MITPIGWIKEVNQSQSVVYLIHIENDQSLKPSGADGRQSGGGFLQNARHNNPDNARTITEDHARQPAGLPRTSNFCVNLRSI